MNNEKLIELITKEVIRRMKSIIEQENTKNDKVLILEESGNVCPIVKSRLEENSIAVDCIDSMSDISDYKCILIQNISNNELRNIAQGYQNSKKEKAIIDILLKGKQLYALEKGVEYEEYKEIAPKALIDVFEEYKNKIASFGVEFTSLKTVINEVKDKKEDNKVAASKKKETKTTCCDADREVLVKKLISEIDIKNLHKDGAKEIIVSKKSIITPLAKDYARINNLVIKFEN
ncbi:MAG: TIGR02536 family ethanolamine utilization protein [Clostridium sp.]